MSKPISDFTKVVESAALEEALITSDGVKRWPTAKASALAAIQAAAAKLVMELVGAHYEAQSRNALRAELRTKAKELGGKGE